MPVCQSIEPNANSGRQPLNATPSWSGLVEQIQRDDRDGMRQLYEVFAKGIRFALWRQLGPDDADDRLHDVFLIVTKAIRCGQLREPGRLMGFVRTVVRRQVAAGIDQHVTARKRFHGLSDSAPLADFSPDPEKSAMAAERARLAQDVLNYLPERDREILTRFYIREESQTEICNSMSLTDTQFRLYKSRAKARFGQAGRRRLTGN